MKRVYLLIILFTFIFSFSCTKSKENIKILVLDELGNKISNARVLIDRKEYLTDENGEIILNNFDDHLNIVIFKENYLPDVIDIKNNESETIVVKIYSLNSKKDEILNKIIEKIVNSKSFYVQFLGNLNGKKENFNLFCDFETDYYKISSPLLTKEIEIRKENGKFYYNNNEFPEETMDYLPTIFNLISDSINFIKNLPHNLKSLTLSSNYNYIKCSFNFEKTNLKISGFIISNYPDFYIISEQINITAIDEIGRINDITLNFYNFN